MPAQSDPHLGTVLDNRYRVLGRIGEGGFGAVYTVQHIHTGKRMAVKVLHAEFTGNQEVIERFRREAQAASLIDHENVVDIIDIGQTPGGSLYFSMELLRGEPLSDLLQREGTLPWRRVREFARQIARALCAAHGERIVHRDLKPANCFRITRGGNPDFVKVLDFGIAKIGSSSSDNGSNLTGIGQVLGTPYYMAPEQAAGNAVDARVDIFSFGVLLFELLTGRLPFQGGTRFEILTKMMTSTPPAVSSLAPHGGIPTAIDELIALALKCDPNQRPATMADVLDVLERAEVSVDGASVSDRAMQSSARGALAFAATVASSPSPEPVVPLDLTRTEIGAPMPAAKSVVETRTDLMTTIARGKSVATGDRRKLAVGSAGLALIAVTVVLLTYGFRSSVREGESVASVPSSPAIEVPRRPAVVPTPEPVEPSPASVPASQPISVPLPAAPPAPEPEPAPTTRPATKTTTKKKKEPSPAPPQPTMTCLDALAALATKGPGLMVKCNKGNAGVTSGDRVRVQLSGNGTTGKVESFIVQSSDSTVFDSCFTTELDRLSFPPVLGAPKCSKEFKFTFP